jgi:hypothetical protein
MVIPKKFGQLASSLLLLTGVLLFPQACQKVEELRACEIDTHCGETGFRCVSGTCVRKDPCGAGVFRFAGRGTEASPYIDELTPEIDKKDDDEILVRQVFSDEQLRESVRQPTFDGEAMLLPADGDRYAMRFEVDFFDNFESKNTEDRLDARNGAYLGVFVEAKIQLNENTAPCAAYLSVWVNKDNFAKVCLGGDAGISLDQGERQKVPIPIDDPNFLLTDEHTYRIDYRPVIDVEREELVYQVEIFVDNKRIATFSADEVKEPSDKPTRFVLFNFGSEAIGGSRWDYVRWGCNPDGGPCIQARLGADEDQECVDVRNSGSHIACPGGRGVAAEICDGIDNNCDGTPDEVFLKSFGPTAILLPDPQDPNNLAARLELGELCQIGQCSSSRVRCDPENSQNLICDPQAHFQVVAGPGGEVVIPPETCNELDDDCDGFVDEDFGPLIEGRNDAGQRRYVDPFDLPAARRAGGPTEQDIIEFGRAVREACGKGVCGSNGGEVACDVEAGVAVCTEPPRPSAAELCGNLKDDDCDGDVDEGIDTNGDGIPDAEGDKDEDGFQACDCLAPGRAQPCDPTVRIDCDDADRLINPDALEICNDKDDNCNNSIDEGFDEDGDGFWQCARECSVRPPDCTEGLDCCSLGPDGALDPENNKDCVDLRNDPESANIHPGAEELCNNIDDDCDDKIDEGNSAGELGFVTNPNGAGIIERGYFTPEHCGRCGQNCLEAPERLGKNWRNACAQGGGGVYECSSICADGFFDANGNDSDGCECAPVVEETCGDADQNFGIAASTNCSEICDGFDNDCDGSIDEGAPINPAVIETLRQGGQRADLNQLQMVTRPCFTGGEALVVDQAPSRCLTGRMTCSGGEQVAGRAEQCLGQVLPLDGEICNGIDDDCDGTVDEETPREGQPCSVPGQTGVCDVGTFQCNAGQEICVSQFQARPEICNLVDDDCDNRVDEGSDQDADGFNTCGNIEACAPGETPLTAAGNLACNDIDEDPFNDCLCADDCNDDRDSGGLINRLQAETCNNLDDNCNGKTDERFVKLDATGSPVTRAGGRVYSVDTAHCSECGSNCDELDNILRGSAACIDDGSSGACTFECLPSYEDRNNDWRDGCELAQCTVDTVGAEAAAQLGQPCSKPIYEDPDPNDGAPVCACRGSFTCVEVGQNQFSVACIVNQLNAQVEEVQVTVAYCEEANGGERELIRNDRQEACDLFDNDCDGRIDEDFQDNRGNYSTLDHCGACDQRCAAPNAAARCDNGVCSLEPGDCAQNFYDANNSLADGCEYFCVKRAQDDRACNGEDDDCDGCSVNDETCDVASHIDEDVRFDTDAENCGQCGTVCAFPNAFARCDQRVCTIDRQPDAPNTAGCTQGFADCDAGELNGCEIQISGDRNNCGACANVCDPDGSDECTGGACTCGARSSCNDPNVPVCDTGAPPGLECVECLQDEHCTGNANFHNVGRDFCIDKHCRECDPVDSSGCLGGSAEPICDRQSQTCLGCQSDAQCTVLFGGRPICVLDGVDDGRCVACGLSTNAGCEGNTPTCERTGDGADNYICRACADDADCGGNRTCIQDDPATLDVNEGRCSGCNVLTNEGCSNPTPICNAVDGGERCEVCVANDECAVGQECVQGSCRECNPQTHAGCPQNQLCCNFECVPTNNVNGCEVCGVQCDTVDSRTCLNRECVCGEAGTGACGGATPFCDDQDENCVTCRDNADCPPGPRPLCVDTNIGGGGSVPQCQECEPGTNIGCDANSDTPFCDADRYICRGCELDGECGDPGQGECVDDGSCQLCDPVDNVGCSANGASVCNDQFECVGCQAHEQCASNANGNICINQRCEGCAGADADARCNAHPEGNVCLEAVANAPRRCGACDEAATGDNDTLVDCDAPRQQGATEGHSSGNICRGEACVPCAADAECAVANAAEPYCVNNRCQACDPTTDQPCDGATPVCNPVTFQCGECTVDGDCNGGRLCVTGTCRLCDPDSDRGCAEQAPVCDGDPPSCRPCVDNAECAGNADGNFCHAGRCQVCNPVTDEGCAPGSDTPVCNNQFTCVGCGSDNDCASNPENGDQCVGVRCETCDPNGSDGCAADSLCCLNGNTNRPECQSTSAQDNDQCTSCGTACDPAVANVCTGRTCGCADGVACDPNGASPHCGPTGCEECLVDGDCGAGVCNPSSFTCEACRVGTHEGCGAEQLCCDDGGAPACIDTGAGPNDACAACGASCDQARSNQCLGRECVCGSDGDQCPADNTPFCLDNANVALASCVQCLVDDDCGVGTQCVNNSCGACDPQNNSGCNPNGTTPFCREVNLDTECQACGGHAECLALNAARPKCNPVVANPAGGGDCVQCLDNPDCDADGTTPICGDNQCARCTGDPQCIALNGGKTHCDLVVGSCEVCLQDADCGLASATPVCGEVNGDAACLGCTDNAECLNNPNGLVCDDNTGVCEECLINTDCDAGSGTPTCGAGNACRACALDADCTGNVNGETCNQATGQCQICVGDEDCGAGELCCTVNVVPECVANDPLNRCTDCGTACDADVADTCTDGNACVCGNAQSTCQNGSFCNAGNCVECRNAGDCGAGEECVGNTCGLPDGDVCAADGDCSSGYCQDTNGVNLCRPAHCNNGVEDANVESGVDCGLECGLCPGSACLDQGAPSNALCASAYCQVNTGLCRITTCGDGLLTQGEDLLDCGGSCGSCDGDACDAQNTNGSCESGYCQADSGLCRDQVCDGAPGCGSIADGGGNNQDCGLCDDVACAADSDCASGFCQPGNDICKPAICDGLCGDQQDTDCGTCDGFGCGVDADCTSGLCEPGTLVCRPEHCGDGQISGDETAADCGGSCSACNDTACNDPSNDANDDSAKACQSNYCEAGSNQCRPAVCATSGPQASPGCGGSCGVCDGGACDNGGNPDDAACQSGFCHPELLICQASHCNNAAIDVDEDFLNCGDPASECGFCNNLVCAASTDCSSGYCQSDSVCRPATCGNGVFDANEVQQDCGNACGFCDAVACALDVDCASGFCQPEEGGNHCRPATCNDGLLNNNEPTIDCGGPCGPTCEFTEACTVDADCVVGSCTGQTCAECNDSAGNTADVPCQNSVNGDRCEPGDICGCDGHDNRCPAGRVCDDIAPNEQCIPE